MLSVCVCLCPCMSVGVCVCVSARFDGCVLVFGVNNHIIITLDMPNNVPFKFTSPIMPLTVEYFTTSLEGRDEGGGGRDELTMSEYES